MIARIRQWLARRRLQRLVEAARNSYPVQDYAKRRRAALRHEPRVFLPASVNPVRQPCLNRGREA